MIWHSLIGMWYVRLYVSQSANETLSFHSWKLSIGNKKNIKLRLCALKVLISLMPHIEDKSLWKVWITVSMKRWETDVQPSSTASLFHTHDMSACKKIWKCVDLTSFKLHFMFMSIFNILCVSTCHNTYGFYSTN